MVKHSPSGSTQDSAELSGVPHVSRRDVGMAVSLPDETFIHTEADVVDKEGNTIWGDIGGLGWLRSGLGPLRFTEPVSLPIDTLEPGYTPVGDPGYARQLADVDADVMPPILVDDAGGNVHKVVDGNHRLEAGKMRGDTTIVAVLYRQFVPTRAG